ncbi:arsenic resistance protein [Alkalicoccobacillus gibsonii]|uniref:arsenic resistance protein n=1 Tax=Alkalicoccobacillus gibsonii TaxID=79881 RepID=UPI0035157856
MSKLEKFQTLLIVLSIVLGLSIGEVSIIAEHSGAFILPFLLVMLYGLFLTIPFHELKKSFGHLPFLGTSLGLNFIWTPILAWGLGYLFLSEHPALWIGFMMLMVTPCTDWYLIFTSIARGNVTLATSVLPVNLILQILLLPLYLWIFAGTEGALSLSTIFESVLLVFILPFALAQLTRFLFKHRQEAFEKRLVPFFSSSQLVWLCLAVVAMFASQGTYLWTNLDVLFLLFIPILLYFFINAILGHYVASWMKMTQKDTVSLLFTTLARNSPVALAVAITAFPDQPVIALALVIGPLIELPVLALVAQLLLRIKK